MKDRVVLGDVDVTQIFHKEFHVVLAELARGRHQPIRQHAQLTNVELEEFHVSLSLFIVLVVLLLSQG